MGKDLIKKIKSSVKYRLVLSGSQQIVGLITGIFLARILSPAEFGVMAVANMIIYYANTFTNFGFNTALVQKKTINDEEINSVFSLDLSISILLLIVTVACSGFISTLFNNIAIKNVIIFMSLYYVLTSLSSIPTVMLRRNINFKFLSIIEFLQSLLNSIISLILAIYGLSYWSLVISTLFSYFIFDVILILKTKWKPKIIFSKNLNDIYSFGFFVFVRNQVELLVSKIDYFVIGKYLNIESLGLYEKGFEFTDRAMSGITKPINAVYYSIFCRVNDDKYMLEKIFLKSTTIIALISYPALFGIIGVSPHFVLSCLGEQWEKIIVPIQILATACLFRVLFGIITSINVAIGMHKLQTFTTIISAFIFVISCFIFVKKGIEAVCIVFLLYSIICFVLSLFILRINIKITIKDLITSIIYPLLGSMLMCFIVKYTSNNYLNDHYSFVQLLYLICIGVIVYILWCMVFYKLKILNINYGDISNER